MGVTVHCISGYLNLRTTGSNTKRWSLEIKMDKTKFDKYFDKEKQRFRKTYKGTTFPFWENYNQIIDKAIKEYEQADSNIEVLRNDKKSFSKYWDILIKEIDNHGTRTKHQNVKDKLDKYLTKIHKSDLLFKDITTTFLNSLKHHFLTIEDPRKLSKNTTNHYLKIISSVITQAEKNEHYNYFKNPFKPIEYKYEAINRNMMSQTEVHKLLNASIPLTDKKHKRIDLSRDMILFQVFANGMRVSDLITLRWSNIKFDNGDNHRLIYQMFKTGAGVDIPLNRNLILILFKIIGCSDVAQSIIDSSNMMGYYNRYASKYLKSKTKKVIEEDKYLKRLDNKEDIVIDIDSILAKSLKENITNLNRQSFIFPILDDKQFTNIGVENKFSNVTEEQYKRMKNCTIVYDRALKDLAKFCQMEIALSSHVSRHTFTNLVLMLKDVNMYDLQQMLRHSSLSITQKYLKDNFNISKQDFISKQLSDFIPKEM